MISIPVLHSWVIQFVVSPRAIVSAHVSGFGKTMKIKVMGFVPYLHGPCPALANVFNVIGAEPSKMCNFKLLKPNPGKAWGEQGNRLPSPGARLFIIWN